MIAVDVKLNAKPTEEAFRLLKERAPIAIARALNRSIDTGATAMKRDVSKDLGLKQSVVTEQFRIERATTDRLSARLSVSGKRIPLINFSAKGPYPSRGKGRGVTYRLPGSAGRVSDAFIAIVGKGAHRGVFVRRGEARLPIVELKGPSLPHVFAKFLPAGQGAAVMALEKNLKHEISYELSQIRRATAAA